MSFSSAFLNVNKNLYSAIEDEIFYNFVNFLQSLTPSLEIDPIYENIKASNMCFGVNAIWVYADGDRQLDFTHGVKKHFENFEKRLTGLVNLDITQDEAQNAIFLSLKAQILIDKRPKDYEVGAKISIFNQRILD